MISVLNLGRCDYLTALHLQETLVELVKQQRAGNVLLFVEHSPVITLGRNAHRSNILASDELLAARGVEVQEINRGGDVTFHGPGQLVAYPIFDLRSFNPRLGAVDYVRRLEDVLMRICAHYRIETQRIKGMTGVWTYPVTPPRLNPRIIGRDYVAAEDAGAPEPIGAPEPALSLPKGSRSEAELTRDGFAWSGRKIAAIGVHISRGVTSHGFALNVTTNLDLFQLIVPCGLTKPVTSIEFETGARPALEEVTTIASRCFGEIFASQMLWLESIHDLLPESPSDTPARAPEDERRIAGDDTHLA